MGAWGTGIFDNDDAMDWVIGWETAPEGEGTTSDPGKLNFVIGALAAAADAKDYLDSDAGAAALAAAEIVAAASGKPARSFVKGKDADESLTELAAWSRSVNARPLNDSKARELACQAIDRVLGPDSELAELWDDSEHSTEWRAIADELRKRLQ
ncbi:MAG: DUF4259 domain-containing protein [Phycisphaerales bacterium]